jgi:hypothetical protein
MTWDEFKSVVDKALAEQGADGSIEIWYIDTSYPDIRYLSVNAERRTSIAEPDKPWYELTISD